MHVIRKELSNEIVLYEFDISGFSFQVKNLTNDDIYVCFGETFNESTSIKIPSYMSQIVTENSNHTYSQYSHDTVSVKAIGEGEVEIQCLEY